MWVCSNMMSDDQVWHQLHECVPPEVTHYVNGDHPGISWYLKTVVPITSDPPLLQYWEQIAAAHDNLVQIVNSAYDWQAHLIPNCVSVWIHTQNHVQLLVEPDQTWCYQIENHVQDQMITHMLEQFDFGSDTWHMIQHALQLKQQHVTNKQAELRRKGFRIHHGETHSGHPHSGKNLDTE